jgi:hypothetical protein
MDLLILVADPVDFLDSDEWLDEISPHWLTLRHPGPFEDLPVRQVLFRGALDFDIVPITAGTLGRRLGDPAVAFALTGGFGGGFRTLIDKDGEIATVSASLYQAGERSSPGPDADEFHFVVNDFLFQVVWTSKHLRRGEVWAAMDDVGCYMRGHLIRMIEWHTSLHGPATSMRTGGRHLERWAAPWIVDRLKGTVPAYGSYSVASAVIAMTDLFGELGRDVAASVDLSYPVDSHDEVLAWAKDCLRPILSKP